MTLAHRLTDDAGKRAKGYKQSYHKRRCPPRVWRFFVPRQKGTEMDNRIEIVVSEDSLFGGWEDMNLYDADASLLAYVGALDVALRAEFVAEVSVATGIMDRVTLGDDNQDDRPYVDQISGDVFEAYGWVRYSEAGQAAGGIDGDLREAPLELPEGGADA